MVKFKVTGMSCAACSARVEKAVSALDGVQECVVSLMTDSMTVKGDIDPKTVISAVEAAGYGASVIGEKKVSDEKPTDSKTAPLIKRLISSGVFLIVLMYISMGHTMWGWYLPDVLAKNPVAIGLLQLLLTAIVMVINQRFFISGFKALIHRAPNMDTLVSLGAAAAFAYSCYALFAMSNALINGDTEHAFHYLHELYFESAAMILTLITVGKFLEAYSRGKAGDAVKSLMELAPKTANVIRDGKEITIGANELIIDDIIVVRPGESIPADAVVIEGHCAVDESALTGESVPVDKADGDTVSQATVNLSGFVKCRVVRTESDSALSQMIQMVSDTAATKAPVAKLADKVSGIFVPTVIAIALITTAIWLIADYDFGFALARGISVLVISCPCALGLATPVAVMVGSGVGAKHGIFYKTAAALEQSGRTKTVVLDKTGTVTNGTPRVTDIISFGVEEKELLYLAATLETGSEHPLAKAVVEYANEHKIPIGKAIGFENFTGSGVTATVDGSKIYGGNTEIADKYCTLTDEARAKAIEFSENGKTPLFFIKDGLLSGIIAVADTIREDSASAISAMKKSGLNVVMLTGDNKRTAKAIADSVGIDTVYADMLPSGKVEKIKELGKNSSVAMIGDGINDAPALTAADTGIAIGAGTDIAIEAADVVLVKSNLTAAVDAIMLSRKTLKNIRENLFWAFIYNAIGIPIAAGILIPINGLQLSPMLAAAAMSLSSFCVVTNALRLNLFKSKSGKPIKYKENKKMQKTIKIEGMMCGHCSAHVKKTLEGIVGVESAEVSHESGTAVIALTNTVDDAVLKTAIEEEGYKVIGIE